jgi:hypothetical protein
MSEEPKTTRDAKSKPSGKRKYVSPSVRSYGNIHEITLGHVKGHEKDNSGSHPKKTGIP